MDQPGERRSHSVAARWRHRHRHQPAGDCSRGHLGLAREHADSTGGQPWAGAGGRYRLVRAPASDASPAGAFHRRDAAGRPGEEWRQLAVGGAGAAVHRLTDQHLEFHGRHQRHCRQPGRRGDAGAGAGAAVAARCRGPGPGLPWFLPFNFPRARIFMGDVGRRWGMRSQRCWHSPACVPISTGSCCWSRFRRSSWTRASHCCAHHFRTTLDGTPHPARLPARGAGRSQSPQVTGMYCFGPVQYYSVQCLLQAVVGGCRGDRVVHRAERLSPPAQWNALPRRKYLTYGFTLAGQNPRPDAAFGHRLPRPFHGLGMLAVAPCRALLDPAPPGAAPVERRYHPGPAAAGAWCSGAWACIAGCGGSPASATC